MRNDPKGCVCNKNTHKCVLVEDKNTPTTDGCNQNITCDEETVFVCGKDGKTYNNPCEAIRCNTVVDCSGKCPCSTTPSVPSKPIIPSPNPGKCNVEDDCELCEAECFEKTMLDQLKSTGKTCGPAKAELKCVCENNLCLAMPDISNPDQPCDDILELVCGADGKTYQNKCEALKADTSVKCSGACPCDTQTPVAPCPAIYQPVCGTNNKTYSNSCSALQAKVDVKCDQACPCSSTPVVPPANGSGSGSTPVLPAQLKQINVHGFCGFQTETICSVDSDCEVAGCSGEICKAKTDGKLSSICNYIDCYTKPSNVYCGCDAGKCK
ncbi:MAG TPA: Kazal-type serine protease inhibitor domain-containing protein [Candidatus Paceibacterota bacterium]|nr:Kazal-type serine protease inhibitor domain-containing protein [Candidatus Paceibacterota bacterium]